VILTSLGFFPVREKPEFCLQTEIESILKHIYEVPSNCGTLYCSIDSVTFKSNSSIQWWARISYSVKRLTYGLECREVGVRVPVGVKYFSPCRSDGLWGPPSFLSIGYRRLFAQVVKRQGREADQSPPAFADVKIRGSIYPPLHASSRRSVQFVKHRNIFAFSSF
jgi:hypothetical protein